MVGEKQKRVIGIITNDRHGVFQHNIINGVNEVATQHKYGVIVDSIAEDPDAPKPISLDLKSLAGLLVISNVLSDDELLTLYNTGLPISLVSHYLKDIAIPAIISDNEQGISELTNYLITHCGCSKILFIRGDMSQRDGIERDLAFRQELIRHDLEINEDFFVTGDFSLERTEENFSNFLQNTSKFDAILASDYLMAVKAIDVLDAHGIRVPQDVCVAGFGDGPEAISRKLTTVGTNVVEVGRRSAFQLIGQIEGLHIRGLTILSTPFMERKTCCVRK